MEPKISIIIPVYNVEKYLSECLESCINQTLQEIEIICVNDFSTDNSIEILSKYAERDNRIKIINHEKNKGLGAARNTGMYHANGEYIWFVDSDDFIDNKACQVLYNIAKTDDVDILRFCGVVFRDYEDGRRYEKGIYHFVWPANQVLDLTKNCRIHTDSVVSACMYISKNSYISNYKFREGVYYEDTDFTPILFHYAKKILCISFSAYYRRLTPGSITQSSVSHKHLQDRLLLLKAYDNYFNLNQVSLLSHLYRTYLLILLSSLTFLKKNISDTNKSDQIEKEIHKYSKKLKLFKIKYFIVRIYNRFICK